MNVKIESMMLNKSELMTYSSWYGLYLLKERVKSYKRVLLSIDNCKQNRWVLGKN